jgi:cell filamentation protein
MNDTNWDAMPLDKKIAEFTNQLTSLWSIHPFRDGNTRTTITFARQFSKEHGFPMDLGILLDNLSRKFDENGKITQYSIRDKFVLAAIPKEYYPEPEHLNALLKKSIVSGISKNITELQNQLDSREDGER